MSSFCGLHSIEVSTVSPDISLQEAIAHLSEAGVDCLLVVAGGHLLGWLTARDVVRLAAQGRVGENCPVSLVMTQPPYILNPLEAENLLLVAQCLQKYRVYQLPVVRESGELLGVVNAQGVIPLWIKQIDRLEQLEQQVDDRTFLRHPDGRTKQTIGIAQHITTRKQIELDLQSSQHFLSRIVEAVPGIIYIYDLQEDRNIYINSLASEILGYTITRIDELGSSFIDQIIHPDDRKIVIPLVIEQLATKSIARLEYRVKNSQGEWRWVLDQVVVFQSSPDGVPRQIMGVMIDIHDRKIAEATLEKMNSDLEDIIAERTNRIWEINLQLLQEIEEKNQVEIALRKSEDRFKKMVRNVPGIVYQFCRDAQGNYSFTYASEYSRKLYELPPIIVMRDADFIMALTHPEDLRQLHTSIEHSFQKLQTWYYIGRIILPSGKIKWIEAASRPERQANGDTIWDGIVLDVTERELVHIEIRKTLLEKEVLLKEIHHRVKNNLQIVTSLLSLQSQYIKDSNITKLFQESQDRIYTMALIHEQLYGSKNVDYINISTYIEALISYLQQSYFLQEQIHLETQVENTFLNIETAIPCGLIINELVTNALKYAFPADRPHANEKISIEFSQIDPKKFSLSVSDNGVGIDPDIDLENLETLGLSLVRMLTQQLEGELLIKNQPGTQFTIIFSELDYNQRV